MAGIGYKHSDFEKYKLITEKAELTGNPIVSRFPDSFHDLTEVLNICICTYELCYIHRHLMWQRIRDTNAELNCRNLVCSSLISTTLLKMFPKSWLTFISINDTFTARGIWEILKRTMVPKHTFCITSKEIK